MRLAQDRRQRFMSFFARPLWRYLACLTVLAAGCGPSRTFYFLEEGDLGHYKDIATDIEYPDVAEPSLPEVDGAVEPISLATFENAQIWDLALEDAVQFTMANSKIMRTLGGQVVQTPDVLLRGPDAVQSVYSPALAESNGRFGVPQALSAFDAQFSTSMFWERNERPQNLFFTGLTAPTLLQDLGTFQAQISKTNVTGGTAFIRNNTTYEFNTNPSNRFPSFFNTNVEVELRQPVMQGAGVMFNRIAGPGSIPGFYNGVLIARVNTDIALADFETGVRNLVSDVETAYWELYFAYRNLDAVAKGRDSALQTWRRIFALYQVSQRGGEADKEAQAREQYFLFRSQVETALYNLLQVERRLRYIIGIAPSDGRLIRPANSPTLAKVDFDWRQVQDEALTRSVELRRQKWRIKQRELELIASRNFLLPRLDGVARYRWVGFGDQLIDPNNNIPEGAFDNAFETLTDGDFQEWQLGFQFSLPIGFRQELSGVRNAEMQLTRERALLREEELELSHALQDALNDLNRYYRTMGTNFNRRKAAADQVNAVEKAFEAETVTLDLLLDAQRRLADAEAAYFRSLVDYNLSLRQVHLRKGSLLEYNGVYLAEGPWPGKAYYDAEQRARERDAGLFLDYGFQRPGPVSLGAVLQHTGETGLPMEVHGTPTPAEPQPEELPKVDAEQPIPMPGDDQAATEAFVPDLDLPPADTGPRLNPARPVTVSAGEWKSQARAANGTDTAGASTLRQVSLQPQPMISDDESNAAPPATAASGSASKWKRAR
jgi:outer membrane protein TolC